MKHAPLSLQDESKNNPYEILFHHFKVTILQTSVQLRSFGV